jgi:hypothetical protein
MAAGPQLSGSEFPAMTLDALLQSLSNTAPPRLGAPLRALWLEARGDWDGAHEIVAALDSPEAYWIHAYLHRKEADAGNARYWYARAGRPVSTGPHDAEWREIAATLLASDAAQSDYAP